jgi:hypothetical protein
LYNQFLILGVAFLKKGAKAEQLSQITAIFDFSCSSIEAIWVS